MAELTQAEILAQLKVRGFESGFQKTPLREFKGRLMSITGNMVDRFQPPRLEVLYNYAELEVIASTEPYPYPACQIGIFQSTREQSGMGIFGASVDKIINTGIPADATDGVKGQDYLIGKVIHMKLTPGHMMWDGNAKDDANPRGKQMPKDCWECIGVDGIGAPIAGIATPVTPTPTPTIKPVSKLAGTAGKALELLNGKSESDFYKAVFADPVVKGDGALISSILGRTFLAPLEQVGTIVKDADGIYHVMG